LSAIQHEGWDDIKLVRYLVISDIHSNVQALRAVLEYAEFRYSEILCCGDLVGYGADPNAVCDFARTRIAAQVRGNHDRGCAGLEEPDWFSESARAAVLWTRQVLEPHSTRFLAALPAGPSMAGEACLVHGSPRDEDEYLDDQTIAEVQAATTCPLTFFGHTHMQGGYAVRDGAVRRLGRQFEGLHDVTFQLEEGWNYLVNPGSVGQPRDGDPRASFVLYDREERTVQYQRVVYDVAGAQSRIRAEGLPEFLAERLAEGM
jgi:predicted phosphodiesterase